MVVDSQLAYILHKRAYRETSNIIEVFTRDYGRISLMARGSRGNRSRTAGNLLLFTPLIISWQGRGNLPYLKTAERAEFRAPVLKNKALLSAIYINELLMYLLHKDDVQEAVFEQYHQCLYSLENENSLELSLRIFETRLLELLGFGLSLDADAATGEKILADAVYDYHIEYGPVKSRENSANNIPRITGACLILMSNQQYPDIAANRQYLAELKQLMRFVINHYLGNKQLKSRELFRQSGRV